jgi:integrase
MSLGTYPELSLADVRLELAKAKKKLSHGVDPGKEAVEGRHVERMAETVADLAEQYLEKWARPRKRSAAEDERILRKDVLPVWGNRKARDVSRRDVVALLDSIVARGAPIMANRTLATVRRMFNWAVGRDILDASPCVQIERPAAENKRDRVLSVAEIGAFWHGLDHLPIADSIRLALKFQLATAQRRGECAEASWAECDFDESVWTIPAERAKNGVAHRVPLSSLTLDLLDEIKERCGGSDWLFPSPRGKGPITPSSISHAFKKHRDKLGVDDASPHDLRRTAASHMTSLGVSRLVVSKILNHVESGITSVYDQYTYDREKRDALAIWARRISEIIAPEGAADSNVVKMEATPIR